MIIVSQNRKGFVNFDNIVLIETQRYEEDIFTLEAWVKDNRLELGRYATEERAKEVLEEIAQFYYRKDYATPLEPLVGIGKIISRDKAAFYMPEE